MLESRDADVEREVRVRTLAAGRAESLGECPVGEKTHERVGELLATG